MFYDTPTRRGYDNELILINYPHKLPVVENTLTSEKMYGLFSL